MEIIGEVRRVIEVLGVKICGDLKFCKGVRKIFFCKLSVLNNLFDHIFRN